MTISTFLDSCQTDETGLRIVERVNGRVYDGTVRSFKMDEDQTGLKIKLATKKIFIISFDTRIVGLGTHSHWEPLIFITI